MKSFASSKTGAYVSEVSVASSNAPLYASAVTLCIVAFPFAVATVLHPVDALKLELKLSGFRVPHVFTAQQIAAGGVKAVIALGVLVLVQLVCTVMFYRKAQMQAAVAATPALWPIAALLTGIVGNLVWCLALGTFDQSGCIVGLSSCAATVAVEVVLNKLGRNFVLGLAASPVPNALFPYN